MNIPRAGVSEAAYDHSHVALACMQGLMASMAGQDSANALLKTSRSKSIEPEETCAIIAFDAAQAFLAERQKRLNPASSLNETGGAVSQGA